MAANFILRVGDLDLSEFVRVTAGDGLDPFSPAFSTRTFAHSPLSAGGDLALTDADVKEMVWPLYLNAPSKDELTALTGQLDRQLARMPTLVEWRDAAASQSTFFDLASGQFDPEFDFRRAEQGWLGGMLHLWVQPYGHTNQWRLVASAAGSGMLLRAPVPSPLAGDVDAVCQVAITAPEWAAPAGRFVAFSVLAHPSYSPELHAAQFTDRVAGAALVGASGAVASQYLSVPSLAADIACKAPLAIPSVYSGDQRVLAVARTPSSAASTPAMLRLLDAYSQPAGPTAPAAEGAGWGLVDLGVVRVPSALARPTSVKLAVQAGGAAVHISELVILPERSTVFVSDDASPPGVGATALPYDTYHLDGQAGEAWREQAGGDLTARLSGAVRGVVPGLPVASCAAVAALVAPAGSATACGALSVSVQCREQFRFWA